jgi:Concanavalin A-like lectin/glucanases superfamily
MRIVVWGLTLSFVVAVLDCTGEDSFHCGTSESCGTGGVCQPTGFCSFPDARCVQGMRYGEYAAEAFAGQCVDVPGVLARWQFDENAGLVTHDATGHGHDGRLINGVTWAPGLSGSGVRFDGENDYLDVPTISSFGTKSFAVLAWVSSTDRNGEQSRVVGMDPTPGSLFLNFGNGAPYLEARDTLEADWGVKPDNNFDVSDGAWHQIGFVIDREARQSRLYVDGALRKAEPRPSTGSFGDAPDKNAPLRMGGQSSNPANAWSGVLDEVQIFERALSDSDVRALYDAQRRR